jgi:hypothetical protein
MVPVDPTLQLMPVPKATRPSATVGADASAQENDQHRADAKFTPNATWASTVVGADAVSGSKRLEMLVGTDEGRPPFAAECEQRKLG